MVWQTIETKTDIDSIPCAAIDCICTYPYAVIDDSIDTDKAFTIPFNVISVDSINKTTDFDA
ncbi:hypothetical protein HYP54_gp045 [Escherichia phage FEC14]|uniref:Uncharacterized protein n=1 Tax=Escherichia phage FEC14 TaxID=2053671 RepID=A0A2H4PP72_9CAUD|nr:hypothetical protein HYP54_gp045 [Escherichia phage FEC14]ATW66888.1 hypothetical protein [Escherichia phage FEC14]